MPTNTPSRAKLPIMIAAWLLVAVIALVGSGLAGNAHAQAGSDVIPSITLDSNQPGQLVITWATPEQAPTDYRIRWANTNLGFPSYSAANEPERGNEYPLVDVNTLTLSNLTPGDSYKVQIRSRYYNADGSVHESSGPWTNLATQQVKYHPPAVPTGLTASNVQHNSLTITWDNPQAENITGYRVLRGTDAGTLSTLANTQSDSTSYTDSTVEPETTYRYAVVALSQDGNSVQSSTLSATTPAEPSSGEEDETREPPKKEDPPQRVGPRQSTTTTFISNTGQTSNADLTTTRATAFTTGTSTYTLSSVGIHLSAQSGTPTPLVQIYGDTSGNPGSVVATLSNPGSITDNVVNTYTDPANTMLSGSTTYWVVTGNSAAVNGQGFRVRTTDTNNLDSGTAAGWTIGSALYKTNITVTSWITSTSRHLFEIRGTRTDAATGTPAITAPNVFRVPAVLGVDLSGITDTDGVTNIATNATYKWQRFNAAGTTLETDSIGTGSTYTLTHTDATKTLKVVVNFTDDASNSEGPLTSAATSAITAAATDCNAPTYVGGATQLGPARTVTIAQGNDSIHGLAYGFRKSDAYGSLDNTTFTTGTAYEILGIYNVKTLTYIRLDKALTRPNQRQLALHVCDQAYSFGPELSDFGYSFSNPHQDWSPYAERTFYLSQDTTAPTFVSATVNGTTLVITLNEPLDDALNLANSAFTVKKNGSSTPISSTTPVISGRTVTLTLTRAVSTSDTNVLVSYNKPTSGTASKLRDTFHNETATFTDQVVSNTAATGAPTISGIAQVGQTLTASTTSISDTNGLPSVFKYQWKRVDANGTSNSTNIGTDSATYTLTDSEVGKKVLVEVSFTDNANNKEGPLVSAAFPSSGTVSAAPSEVPSSWSLKPTGLAVGDQFRLIFLSSTKRNATSTDIADYNTFVQERAAAGHAGIQSYSTGFRVVGCTGAVDARDNTDTTGRGVPIYWLDGTKVADNYADFYDGSWDDEINDKNESGTDAHDTSQEDNYPFTGCMDDGTESFAGATRPRSLGAPLGFVRIGRLNSSGTLQDPIDGNDVADTAATRPMYGLSAVFQVVAASTDATLSALTVSPKDITGFATDRSTRYEVGVASTVTQATITATTNDSAATVGYSTTDADDSTSGHQVDLSAGRNAVTVTVTAEDTITTQTYTISINRGVDTAFGWKAADDFDGLITAGNDTPSGPWSDDTTMWVSDYVDDKIYAYDLTTKARDASKDFDTLSDAGNENPDGIWSNNITMWVSDYEDSKLYAYSMATKARDPGKDITTAAASAGIWSDGTTMWVANQSLVKIQAYTLATGVRDAGKDFDTLTPAGNDYPGGIWSNNTTMWVTDQTDTKIYAYNMASKAHDAGKDFDTLSTADNDRGVGIWANTDTMWVADLQDDKIYSYNMPAIAANTAPTVANAIPNQSATPNTSFSYQFPDDTFNDADTDDTLTYTATKGDDTGLPTWLMFDATTRTFSGTPDTGSIIRVKVKASDGTDSITDEFDIIVITADIWTATLTVATVFSNLGCNATSCPTALTDDNFTYDSTNYTVEALYLEPNGDLTLIFESRFTVSTIEDITLVIENIYLPLANAAPTIRSALWSNTGFSWTLGNDMSVKLVSINNAPTVANAIPDQSAKANTRFTYTFPDNTFNDADTADTLTYSARKADDSALPTWLAFDADNRTFSGTPTAAETVSVKVTASDGSTTVSDEFDITVSAAPTTTEVPETWSLKPTALNTGDQFRLIFLSSTKRDASPNTIADYNTFVQGRAAAGHNDIQSYSTGFRVVGCTEAVDARDNTATTFTTNDKGVPIYWLNGTKVADEYEDFYDGSWDDEANDKDESGTDGLDASLNANRPLTGCDDDGTEAVDFANRSVALGSSLGVMIGRPNFATAGPLSSSTHSLPSVTRPMYGLSEVFEVSNVPAAISDVAVVPEPRTTDSLRVSWTAPNNTGKPALTAYDLRYKEFDADNWTTARQDDAASTSLIIDGLRTAYYDVQVRAINAEYSGPWSSTAEGATSPPSETVLANHPLIPADLGPGDSFRLLHVTSGTRAATGTGIHKYHDSVGSDPILLVDPAGLMDEWGGIFLHQRALVSTPGADARLHTDTTWTGTDRGVPIYWINGTRVADDYADLYDGAWDDEANPMNGFGEPRSLSGTAPWTGTSHDGTELFEGGVSRAVGQSMVGVGGPGSNVVGAGPLNGGVTFASTEERPLYGLWHVMVIDENLRLVSNLTQSRSDASSDDRATVRAQLFTTGPNSSGYGIARIKVDRGSETEDFLGTVALYTTDAQGDPDLANGLHATLSLESTFAYQWYLTAPVGTVVKPNTTYSLVFQGDGGTYPELWTSGADGEDLAAEGWSIADVLRYHDGSNWVDNGNGKSLRMRIIGTLAADTTEVPSNWGLKPTAVAAGSQFRLIFLSSTKRNGSSTAIADYNTFVQARAAAGHTDIRAYSAGFRVVGCTADVDARDNTSTTFTTEDKGVPIYWLNGAKVADEYEDFYDGDWDDEVNDKDESGTNGLDISLNVNSPFTGCAHNGTEALDGSISQGFAAVGGTKIGRPNSTGSGHGPLSSNAVGTTTNTRPMYGLSEVFQVAEPTNTPATGEPTISGTAAAGQTLTASTAGISDTDGLPSNFTYQWKRVDSDGMSNPTNIGADSATYTLTDDEVGKKVKVEVSFTDNESNSEGPLISAAYPSTGTVKAPIGPPQGLTAEAGDERVRLVWANPTGITQFTEYQYRYAAGTSVPSGTSWTGTGHAEALTLLLSGLTNATAHAFEVRVISDGREGAAATVSETPLAAVCNTDLGTRRELWSATMTVGANTGPSVGRNNAGYYRGNYGTLPQHGDTISIGDASYTIDYLNTSISPEGARRRIFLELVGDSRFTPAVKNAIQLHWCGESSGFFDPTPAGYLASNSHNADWSLYTTRELALSLPANNDATGTPMITGTAVVAQTLTVSAAGISDPDGLPTTFTYQWKRVDSDGMSNPTTIGADAATYTLTSSEVGKKVLVEVSFTDSLGEAESLASAAHPSTGTVRAADSTAPTVTSIERHDPTALLTNSDTPTWRVTFSEVVKNVDTTDFTITGTTATPTATAVTLVPGGYDVTPTGGDIASLTGTITLTFAAAQNIADTADNDLAATAPTGTDEPTFELDNTIPAFDSGTANGVLIVLTFSEALDPDSLPPGAAFFINTITTNVSVDNVSIAGAIVTLTVSPPILVDQTVEVSNNAYDGAGYVPLKDFAGNEVTPAVQTGRYTITNNTPLGPPTTLRAEPGDGRVRLVWKNPAGIPGFIGHEYRHAAGSSVPAGTAWTRTTSKEFTTVLVQGLTNGTVHAFEVRAWRSSEVSPTATVSATPLAAVCNTNLGDRREVWSATMTVGTDTDSITGSTGAGYVRGSYGNFPPNGDIISIGGDSYTIKHIFTAVRGSGATRGLFLESVDDRRLTPAVKDAIQLHWCNESSGLTERSGRGYRASNPNNADWSLYTTRDLALSLPANNAATGKPEITGTALVGQILTATKGDVADTDGLPSAFTYQWKRVDSDGTSNPTNIGIDSATYTLTTSEVGKRVLVEVSFTDDLSGAESRTSDVHPSSGTVTVGGSVALREDSYYAFDNSDFSYAISSGTITSLTITEMPASGTLTKGGRPINNLPDTIPTTGSQRRTLLYKPPPDAHGTPYTTFKFKVNKETTVHTMTINVTSVNDRAYGKVFISGATQVGYDLTASTSSMGDRDGIPRDQLDYQWKRYAADGTTFEADIGANSSTYTLTSSEQGKKIRVEVSYVDGGGTREVRLSDAFPYITDQTVGEATFQSIMGSAGDTFYVVSDKDHGQTFTTGTHPNGYTLSRVVLQSEDAEGDDLAVKICGVNTNGDPTAVCTDLTVPGSFTKGLLSFTAPSNTTLTGGRTNYMVVISSPGSQSVRLDATRSDGFDSSALGSGWSIATKTRMKTTDGWKNVNGTRIRIAILGAINP